ncbi:MAG: hypothetical protein HZB50_03520 [Chloroflexi bacterium]|nr:hypothetical protein [Chloroflexota bacterium]
MFRKGPFIFFRLIGLLLLIGLIVGGGAMAYRAGIAQGISQSPAVATAISKAAESGQVAPAVPPMMYGRGYGLGFYPMMGHRFFMFPFGAICGSIFFLFLFFGLLRMVFFRGMHHHGHHGPWGKDWEGGVPPMFNEWHKRAHGEKSGEEGDKKE